MVSFVRADPSPSFDGFSKCPQENHEKNPKDASILQNKTLGLPLNEKTNLVWGKKGARVLHAMTATTRTKDK